MQNMQHRRTCYASQLTLLPANSHHSFNGGEKTGGLAAAGLATVTCEASSRYETILSVRQMDSEKSVEQ